MPGTHRPLAGDGTKSWRNIAIGAVVVATCAVVLGALAVLAWRNADTELTEEQVSDAVSLTAAVEPADSIGPNAFTPPVTTDDPQICDKERFVEYLEERPDAKREWARVLDVPEEDIEEYVMSLEPIVLSQDTLVTNHGLADGKAYARLSLLEQGTAVLAEPDPPDEPVPPGEPNPPEEATTTTAPPEPPTVVTRCKCGNPLLPPPDTTTTTSSTTSSTTTVPEEPPDEDTPPSDEPPSDEPPSDEPPSDEPPSDEPPEEPPNGATPPPNGATPPPNGQDPDSPD